MMHANNHTTRQSWTANFAPVLHCEELYQTL